MSHYSESLNKKLPMCPCSSTKDIPQDAKEASEESEAVGNGFEVLSADSGSDEEQDTLGAQGYVPLSQNEDETIAQDTIVVQQEASVINQPDEEQTHHTQPELEGEEKSNNVTASSTFAFSSARQSQMGEDEIDFIKSVMMNIKLPSSSIPEWAKKIPEENWKVPLVSSIKQQSSSDKKCIDRKSTNLANNMDG